MDLEVEVLLIPYFAEVITAEDKSDKVLRLQFEALRMLQARLRYYEERGYADKLITSIAEKKGEMILAATTKSEMEKVANPHAPHYDGSKFIPDKYSVPEEELICWSEISLKGPLIPAGMKRYMELFRQFFPVTAETAENVLNEEKKGNEQNGCTGQKCTEQARDDHGYGLCRAARRA